jgi:hypothetical protein
MSATVQGRWAFLLPILLFAAVCAAVMFLTLRFAAIPTSGVFWDMLAWFTVLTVVLHAWQEGGRGGDPKIFVRRFMAGLVIKMMLSLVALVVLLVVLPKDRLVPAAITFVLLYLAFLGFSTARSVGLMRRNARP